MSKTTTKNIRSFEEACKSLGLDPANVPDVSMLAEKHRKAIEAHYKLVIIAQALNGGWEPNWNDRSEAKYYPWFEIEADEKRPAGFGFSDSDYDGWNARSTVGSRLAFRTRELATYAGKQFQDLYKEYFLIA